MWNEAGYIAYWHGTPEEYYRLYDASAAGVRAALPGARVGGPATTGPVGKQSDSGPSSGYNCCADTLEHVRDTKQPLDFISFHAKGSPRIANREVTMGIRHELSDVNFGFATIQSFPEFSHLPLILSEADPEGCAACSMKTNPANAYRNGTLYPASTAAAYARILQVEDVLDFYLFAMLSWAFEFVGRVTFEGFRSLATNGIDKPVLNFFRMAAKMSGERVEVDSTGAVPLDLIRDVGVRESPDVDGLATVNGDAGMGSDGLELSGHDRAGSGVAQARVLVQRIACGREAGAGAGVGGSMRRTATRARAAVDGVAGSIPTRSRLAKPEAAGQLQEAGAAQGRWMRRRVGVRVRATRRGRVGAAV